MPFHQQRIDQLSQEILTILSSHHLYPTQPIIYSWNPRLRKCMGRCRLKQRKYHIELNCLLKDHEDMLKDVLAHEIIHTLDGCFNHQKKFKEVCHLLNQYGYQVHVRFNPSQYGHTPESLFKTTSTLAKYKIECTSCHQVFYRQKNSKLIQHPEWYCCKNCHGSLQVTTLT